MALPFAPPLSPMLAKASDQLPTGPEWLYEPKWDGFRCIVFADKDSLELTSRNERPLTRYFPEVVEAVRAQLPSECVVDGEVVIAGPDGLDFDALLQRIHPASSRVARLAAETPASFVAFDLLALGSRDLRGLGFAERRALLEEALSGVHAPVHLTPMTADPVVAADWFNRFEGAGLDGVVAKKRDIAYLEDQRVMMKIKHRRSADCVVGGFRWRSDDDKSVGSLLLGLYDANGTLHHIGVTSSFNAKQRRDLVEKLAPFRVQADDAHPWTDHVEVPGRRPGTPSRWNAKKDLSFEPLSPELVCEVAYDHLQGDRFRHAATFLRWRDDRDPSSCRYDQLQVAVPAELAEVFAEKSR